MFVSAYVVPMQVVTHLKVEVSPYKSGMVGHIGTQVRVEGSAKA